MPSFQAVKNFISSHYEMSSIRHPQESHSYPPVPPTLAAHDYEAREGSLDLQPHINTDPRYTPYLGLRARLSQVLINRWTVLLLLILCRLLLTTQSLNDNLDSAKAEALSACTSVEKVGSSMASMPHYLSGGVNALAADGVTAAVNALMDMLLMTVTGVGEIILFFINLLTSTYVCLITLVVAGSLHVALDVIKKVTEFVEKTIEGVTDDMSGAVSGFQDLTNKFLSGINFGGIFNGGSKDPPKIDLTKQIDQLKNIDIDTNAFVGELENIKKNIPNFEDVKEVTDAAIRFPFEQVKKLINESMSTYTFDRSVFPLAQKKELSFCTDNPAIENFFGNLVKVVSKSRTVFMAVLIILAILVCVPMAYREVARYRMMKKRAALLQKGQHFDPMDVIYIASRPHSTTVGIKAASTVKSTKKQILIRWLIAYATSTPATFVLTLGITGLFSCLCQYIVLKVLQREVPALASEVGDFSQNVVYALNNASTDWAVSSNAVITATNNQINRDVFGWVNTTTSAVNKTLNTFSDEMAKGLDIAFGGTILHDPISEVLKCLIGLKIIAIQKALTWASDNANVKFPLFRPDVFSLGAAASLTNTTKDDSFLASPGSVATDDITAAVVKVSNKLQSAIREEAIISSVVVAIWVLVCLIGLARVIVAMLTPDKTRAEGGPVGFTGDQRSFSPRSPNRHDVSRFPVFGGPVSSVHPEKSSDDLAFNEKTGHAGHRSVESAHVKGHERVSSYGSVSGYGDSKR